MKPIFCLIINLNLIILSLTGVCQTVNSLSEIKKELKKIEGYGSSLEVGFKLLSEKGEELIQHNSSKNLIPASTLKIYTTGAALSLLGAEYKFTTFIEFEGTIDPCGKLHGNLFVRGTGDPTLGSERIEGLLPYPELLNQFAEEVKKFGITSITGHIVGDDRHFNDCLTPPSWPLKDVANYFGAGPNGLCINENSYKLIFRAGKTLGSKTEIIGTNPPDIPGLFLENKVTTYYAGSGDRAVIMADPTTFVKDVIGTIPMGVSTFTIRGSMPDPGLLVAAILKEKLENLGVEIEGKIFSGYQYQSVFPSKKPRNIIYQYSSPSLLEIVRQTNMRSHNLFAETLTIALGKEFRGIGNYESGVAVVRDFWSSKSIDVTKAEIFDGSGLSPLNRVSPNTLTSILSRIKEEESFESFLMSLPVAGMSGTVKSLCAQTSAKGKIFVKSGSIEEVISYSGYGLSKSGKYLPFSIMINKYTGSRAQLYKSVERILVLITNLP